MGRVFAVCSGSGGVGKTTIALSLAVCASKAGKRTLLLDASGPARSADLILGLSGALTLDMADVAAGDAAMEAALYPAVRYPQLRLACASLHDEVTAAELSGTILALHSLCDILVIDLPTGQAALEERMLTDEDIRIIVLRPDDASIRSTERLLSGALPSGAQSLLLLNRTQPTLLHAGQQYDAQTVQTTLDCPVLGEIPEDGTIPLSAIRGRPAIECDGPAWTALSQAFLSLLES